MQPNDAARRANARAFVRQELKPGRAWASLKYEYDTELPEQEQDDASKCDVSSMRERPDVRQPK